jgi:hypothetical protein
MSKQIKIYSLGVAGFLFQSLTWFFLHQALIVTPSVTNWVFVSLSAAAAISVMAFFLLTNKSRWLADIVIVLSAMVYVAISPKNIFIWIGGLIFVLFALWYEERLRREAKSRIDFSVTRVIGGSVSILIYGILLLLAFNIYYNVSADFRTNPDKFYNTLGQQAARSVVPYAAHILPSGVNLNEPVADYFADQAKTDPDFNQAGSFGQEILVSQAKRAFESQFQITVSDNQTLGDVMAQVAVNKIRQATGPFENYLPFVFTLLVLGLLYTFAFVIRWIVLLISWLLFRILLAFGFFHLEKVQVEVEKLEI